MDAIALLREQLATSRDFLHGTLADVTADDARASPPGATNSIAATYAHLLIGEDGFINGLLRGHPPLAATDWAGKMGLSEQPPQGPDWNEWGKRVRVDLNALRAYDDAVAASTDAFLASLVPADLARTIDLSAFGFGERPLSWVLSAGVVGHLSAHWGEICALKGLRGGKGFPV